MLSQMLYISTAVGPITTAVTSTILRSAQAHNAANQITGVLCQGQGVYVQVLEGERSKIDALYAHIVLDKRHENVVLHQYVDISRRRYGRWSMAHVDMSHPTPEQALPRVYQALFDPYTATGEELMEKIDALITAGKIMDAPVM